MIKYLYICFNFRGGRNFFKCLKFQSKIFIDWVNVWYIEKTASKFYDKYKIAPYKKLRDLHND